MKKIDVRASLATLERKQAWLAALTSVIDPKALSPPDFIVEEATAQRTRIETDEPFKRPSLLLSVYLSGSFLGNTPPDIAFRRTFWSKDRYLSTMIKSGRVSAMIWKSFQALPPTEQMRLRLQRGAKNKPLSDYAQLYNLLNPPANSKLNNQDRLDLLAKLVNEESAFVSQQLHHDPELRTRYFIALSDPNLADFKSLIMLLPQCPLLADKFTALIRQVLDPTTNDQWPDPRLYRILLGYLQTDNSIAEVLLRNSSLCESDPEFVSRVLITRTGALEEYKAKAESTWWLLGNALKGILEVLLPYSLVRFMSPKIHIDVLDKIEIEGYTLKPAKKPAEVFKPSRTLIDNANANATFLQFSRTSANDLALRGGIPDARDDISSLPGSPILPHRQDKTVCLDSPTRQIDQSTDQSFVY